MSNSVARIAETAALLARAAAELIALAKELAAHPPANDVAPPLAPATPTPSAPEYLDTAAAAALLGISKKGLEALRARGAGPKYVRIGRRVRYLTRDLPGVKQ